MEDEVQKISNGEANRVYFAVALSFLLNQNHYVGMINPQATNLVASLTTYILNNDLFGDKTPCVSTQLNNLGIIQREGFKLIIQLL